MITTEINPGKQQKLETLQKLEHKFKRRETYSRERRGDLDSHDYFKAQMRVYQLAMFIKRRKETFDISDNYEWSLDAALETRENRIQRGKERFENNYVFHLHFLQDSLRADYGEFYCPECHRTFYHSPCDIYKAGKEIKSMVCGHCANTYARSNGQDEIYY